MLMVAAAAAAAAAAVAWLLQQTGSCCCKPLNLRVPGHIAQHRRPSALRSIRLYMAFCQRPDAYASQTLNPWKAAGCTASAPQLFASSNLAWPVADACAIASCWLASLAPQPSSVHLSTGALDLGDADTNLEPLWFSSTCSGSKEMQSKSVCMCTHCEHGPHSRSGMCR